MKRLPLIATLGVVAVVALAGRASAQAPPSEDSLSADGNVFFTQGLATLEWHDVGATSGPSGQNASGRVLLYSESPSGAIFQVFGSRTIDNVTCLGVQGNVAVVGFQDPAGLFFIQYVDNGPSLGPLNFGPDLAYRPLVLAGRAPTDCSPLPPDSYPPDLDVLVRGEVAIQDAHPLPSTKEQCKNGGWRTYGVFKNQGACVSFVATGGKNPPAGH